MWVLKPAIPIKFGFRKLPQLAASFIRELVGKRRPLAFPATMALQMVQAAPIPTPAVLQISQQFFSRKFAYQAMIRPFPALGLSAFLVHARQSRLRIGIASSPGPHLSLIASYFQSARSTAGLQFRGTKRCRNLKPKSASTSYCKPWSLNPYLRESLQQKLEHQSRLTPQVMAILELAQVKLQVLLRNPNVSPVDTALHLDQNNSIELV